MHDDEHVQVSAAAFIAAALLSLVAVFQVALALGAPYGEATMGGRADTVDGVLTNRYRAIAAISAVVLVACAGAVLVDEPSWPKWAIAALLAASAAGSLTAPHRLERRVFGPIAVVAAVATAVTALTG